MVRDVAPVDTAEITALLAGTIGEGPVARWLTPDPVVRRRERPRVLRDLRRARVQHGEIYATVDPGTGDLVGVALWFPLTRRSRRRATTTCG